MKVAILDFCDTIVDFQTANAYALYTLEHLHMHSLLRWLLRRGFVRNYFRKHWMEEKRLLLYMLRGTGEESLFKTAKGYYNDMIKPHFQVPVVDEIKKLREQGYTLYLVSGGYSIYIRLFAEEYGFEKVISNDFMYDNGVFTGRLCDKDCMGEEKVRRINMILNKDDTEDSVSISDSISDLPILKWADRAIVVSKKSRRKWAEENGFDQMVLSEINSESESDI